MQQCNLLKEVSLNIIYRPETYIHCPKVAKHHVEKAKKVEKKKKYKKANEATPAAVLNPSTSRTNSIPQTSAQVGRDAANSFTAIEKGSSKPTLEAEAKQAEVNNLTRQAKASQDEASVLVNTEDN